MSTRAARIFVEDKYIENIVLAFSPMFCFKCNYKIFLLIFGLILAIVVFFIWNPFSKSASPKTDSPEYRRAFIRNMTLDAWSDYTKLQYPKNDYDKEHWILVDQYKLIQSLSTLWIMNLTAEFSEAKSWIQSRSNFTTVNKIIYVDTAVNEYIGSMLSCYALTEDSWFLKKAYEVGIALKPAHETNGLPYAQFRPSDASKESFIHNLGQLGGQHLEYRYLADLTNDIMLNRAISKIRHIIKSISKPKGLYMTELNSNGETVEWRTSDTSLFTPSSVFYSYLIKAYIQSNCAEQESNEMFNKAMDAVEAVGMIGKSNRSETGFTFVRDYDTKEKSYGSVMRYDGCSLGAMFGLSVWSKNQSTDLSQVEAGWKTKHWNWAVQLTKTCHYVATRTPTGMVPNTFGIQPNGNLKYDFSEIGHLRPYLAESYFVMYRLTKDSKYRQYAWELAQSISAYYRSKSSRTSTDDVSADQYQYQEWNGEEWISHSSDYIGATLKYLYLTFTEDYILPLDQWVFNRAGQPLPICSRNKMYPEGKCGRDWPNH